MTTSNRAAYWDQGVLYRSSGRGGIELEPGAVLFGDNHDRLQEPEGATMNQENTARLYERFDHLYRGRHLPDTQNLMCYGFHCGDGWFDLVWQLSEQIEAYCQTHPDAADLIVMQVKQKFGELRFYTQPKLWEVEYLIEAARIRSLQTCELTGTPGSLCRFETEGYWGYSQTLCPTKAAELGFLPTPTVRVEWQLPHRPSA